MTVSNAVRWGNSLMFWNVRARPKSVRFEGRE